MDNKSTFVSNLYVQLESLIREYSNCESSLILTAADMLSADQKISEEVRTKVVKLVTAGNTFGAAMALVPEGFAIHNLMIWPGEPTTLTLLGTREVKGKYWHCTDDGKWEVTASTPALAICLACVMAYKDNLRKSV